MMICQATTSEEILSTRDPPSYFEGYPFRSVLVRWGSMHLKARNEGNNRYQIISEVTNMTSTDFGQFDFGAK